jgi:hypothetical protein
MNTSLKAIVSQTNVWHKNYTYGGYTLIDMFEVKTERFPFTYNESGRKHIFRDPKGHYYAWYLPNHSWYRENEGYILPVKHIDNKQGSEAWQTIVEPEQDEKILRRHINRVDPAGYINGSDRTVFMFYGRWDYHMEKLDISAEELGFGLRSLKATIWIKSDTFRLYKCEFLSSSKGWDILSIATL